MSLPRYRPSGDAPAHEQIERWLARAVDSGQLSARRPAAGRTRAGATARGLADDAAARAGHPGATGTGAPGHRSQRRHVRRGAAARRVRPHHRGGLHRDRAAGRAVRRRRGRRRRAGARPATGGRRPRPGSRSVRRVGGPGAFRGRRPGGPRALLVPRGPAAAACSRTRWTGRSTPCSTRRTAGVRRAPTRRSSRWSPTPTRPRCSTVAPGSPLDAGRADGLRRRRDTGRVRPGPVPGRPQPLRAAVIPHP